jgi:hypothetical protein
MKRCCLACGRTGNLEIHHVGGRKYSPVTVELCSEHHRYCTQADYERQWSADYPPLRIWAGAMDVLDLCGRSINWGGISCAVSGYLRDAEATGIYAYRPAAAVVTVNGSTPDMTEYRISQLERMTVEAICAMISNSEIADMFTLCPCGHQMYLHSTPPKEDCNADKCQCERFAYVA